MVISQDDTQEHVLTSPQPLAEVTLLKAKLMLPPPVPFCVDKEPDKIAVSVVVRGAYNKEQKTPVINCLLAKLSQTTSGRHMFAVLLQFDLLVTKHYLYRL